MLADDELVTTVLDGELVELELMTEVMRKLLDCGARLLDGGAITSERDVLLDVVGGERQGSAGFGDGGNRLERPGALTGDIDPDTVGLLKSLDPAVAGPGDEGIELGRDPAEFRLGVRIAFVYDLEDLITGGSGGDGVALDLDGNLRIVVVGVDLGLLQLGEVDPSTSPFLDGLDGRALLTDDVGAGRLRDGERDRDLPELVSIVP